MELPFFNKKKTDTTAFQEEKIDIKDIIAPPYIGVTQNYIKIGEKIAKSFFIFAYPRYLNTGWLSSAINLNARMNISFFVTPVDNTMILKKLRSKVTQISSELMEKQEK